MPTGPLFRDSLLATKRRLFEQRESIRALHGKGSSGQQVCSRLTELLDSTLLALFESAIADLNVEHLREYLALVPHSGTGRRDVAPYSDLDLMVLAERAGVRSGFAAGKSGRTSTH